ncbi:MAG: hypothetical protein HQ522_17595 [Bacteroidetes bacterium]|nr:hypothetical protein [Bacteroidota bacterium]
MKIPKIAVQAKSPINSKLILKFMEIERISFELKDNPLDADYIFLFPLPFEEMLEWCHKYKNKILIFIGAESYIPDFNLFDYTFSYDKVEFGDRHMQIQFQALLSYYLPQKLLVGKDLLKKKENFCNFIYSNPKAHPNRDLFFHTLNKYKKVDSLGAHLKNVNLNIGDRKLDNYFQESIKQKESYKFSISFENALHKGYNTEKIISSMEAYTIPIYWGDSEIGEFYNSRSFINCHNYQSFNEVINFIIEIDNDDDLFLEILNQPWRTKEQEIKFVDQKKSFINRLNHIFSQPYPETFRKPMGTYNDFYSKKISTYNKTSSVLLKLWRNIHHQAHLVKKALKK